MYIPDNELYEIAKNMFGNIYTPPWISLLCVSQSDSGSIYTIGKGYTNFPKTWKAPQNSRRQKGDTKQVSCRWRHIVGGTVQNSVVPSTCQICAPCYKTNVELRSVMAQQTWNTGICTEVKRKTKKLFSRDNWRHRRNSEYEDTDLPLYQAARCSILARGTCCISSVRTFGVNQNGGSERQEAAEAFCKAVSCSATPHIPRMFYHQNLHYRILFLSQINPIHIFLSRFIKIYFKLSLYLLQNLATGLLPSGFPSKTLYKFIFSPCMLQALSISSFLIRSPY